MALQGYFNRFDASKRYDELLFRASRGLQSAELNEIQAVLSDRMKRISDVLFRDGGVVRGASPSINPQTGVAQLDSGAVYVLGAVRDVAARTITIPTTGNVQIGVRVITSTITEQEDASLRDPAVGTRNFQEAGAGRTRRLVAWAWSGDGEPGDFFSVYSVLNGVLVTQELPPALDGVVQIVARYDRDANGNYIVRGTNLVALGKDDSQTNYIYSVQEGVANVAGVKIDRPTATPYSYPINPDLQAINNEPRSSASNGVQTITTSRSPLNNIQDVVITAEKTVNIAHGSFSGALDPLPDTAVLSIESVTQGGTTYVQGTDFVLTADQVDWSLPGNEPSPGSSYTVTYRYITTATPTNIDPDAGTFQIEGSVQGTLVLTSYQWKLPRIDVLTLDSEGVFALVKGVASAFEPAEPLVPDSKLAIASIYYDWKSASVPEVDNNGTRVVPMREQRQLKSSVIELYDLISEERLQRDIASREPTAKFGLFVDPFISNNQRDAGVAQTAVIVDQELQLSISANPIFATLNNVSAKTLPFTDEILISQDLQTGSMAINPYANFDPIWARVSLQPNIDLWTVTDDQTLSTTQRLTSGWGNRARTTVNTVTTLASEQRSQIEFLRQRSVEFTVQGFKPSEGLMQLRFDGRDITPAGIVANLSGELTGALTVPAGVPAGTKLVEFVGDQGNYGAAEYTGQGTLVVRRWSQVTTILTQFWYSHRDPIAQSFTLEEDRSITGVDLKFAAVGTSGSPVMVQLRDSVNGFPGVNVLGDAIIPANQISTTNAWVRAEFGLPVSLESGQEYFIVLMSDDDTHAVRVAELGKFDNTQNRFVTAQPYTVGVLVSSSNNSTWTAHQEKDMTFRLVGASFTANSQTFNLGSITVSGMTDLQVLAPVNLPGTTTSVSFRYTRSTGEVFTLSPGQALRFATTINDTMQIQAVLNGTAKLSPTLFGGVQTVAGSLAGSADYVSRQFQIGAGGGTMRVVFEAKAPGTSTVVPQYDNSGFQSLTLASATPRGDGFVEYVYQDTGIVGLTASKVKLNMTGTPAHRPVVRNLRAVMV